MSDDLDRLVAARLGWTNVREDESGLVGEFNGSLDRLPHWSADVTAVLPLYPSFALHMMEINRDGRVTFRAFVGSTVYPETRCATVDGDTLALARVRAWLVWYDREAAEGNFDVFSVWAQFRREYWRGVR